MSLLNNVLKELDRRQARPSKLPGLDASVQHIEAPGRHPGVTVLGLLMGLLLAGGLLHTLRPDLTSGLRQWLPGTPKPPTLATPAQTEEPTALPAAADEITQAEQPEQSEPTSPSASAEVGPGPATASTDTATVNVPLAQAVPATPSSPPPPPPAVVAPPSGAVDLPSKPVLGLLASPPNDPGTAAAPLQPIAKSSGPTQQAEVLVAAARDRLSLKDHPGALRQLEQALALAPDLSAAHHLLVVTHLETGQVNSARAQILEGLARHPDDHFLLVARTRLELESGDSQAAIDSAAQALDRYPDDGNLHGLMGLALLSEGQVDPAIGRLQRALTTDPLSPSWLIGLASALDRAGQTEGARQLLMRAQESGRLSGSQRALVVSRLGQLAPDK